ncbi:MAG: hypothetical protein ACPF8V_03850, partial [Luteibaculum sp.]
MKKKTRNLELLLSAGDYLVIVLGFIASYYFRFNEITEIIRGNFFALGLFMLLAWAICSYSLKLYGKFFTQDRTAQWFLWIRVFVFHLLLVIAFNGLIKTYFSRQVIFTTYCSMFVLHTLWRLIFPQVVRTYYKKAEHVRKAIIVGAHFEEDFIRFIE